MPSRYISRHFSIDFVSFLQFPHHTGNKCDGAVAFSIQCGLVLTPRSRHNDDDKSGRIVAVSHKLIWLCHQIPEVSLVLICVSVNSRKAFPHREISMLFCTSHSPYILRRRHRQIWSTTRYTPLVTHKNDLFSQSHALLTPRLISRFFDLVFFRSKMHLAGIHRKSAWISVRLG